MNESNFTSLFKEHFLEFKDTLTKIEPEKIEILENIKDPSMFFVNKKQRNKS